MMAASEWNVRTTAAVGLLLSTVLVVLAFRISDIPFLNLAGDEYSAEFSDAGGLKSGDPVQVAGIVLGRVEEVEIKKDRVVAHFNVDQGTALESTTYAKIKVASLLGAKYLDLDPQGGGTLEPGSTIPLSRTTPVYDVVTAFRDLADVEGRLDVETISESLDTLSTTFQDSPVHVRSSLRGLSRLSKTISSRDEEIKELFHHAATTSEVLDRRRGDFAELLESSNLLLEELEKREKAIHSLLLNTVRLSRELHGLIKENQSTLTPALKDLETVTKMLASHQSDLRALIRDLNNYGQIFNNVIGSGPWFDVVIPRLPQSVTVTPR